MPKIPDLPAVRDWCLSKFQPAGNYASASDIPTVTSKLTNDSGYITADDLENDFTNEDKAVLDSFGDMTSEEAKSILDEEVEE